MPVALLNMGLVSATVFLGLHYVTDLIGTALMLAASLFIYRRFLQRPEASERASGA
jgi:hypothetical protein